MKVDRAKIVKYTVVFLLVMLFFTIISNKVSYMMLPEVATTRPSAGRLSYELTAAGYYEGGKVTFWVNLEKEQYIAVGDKPTAEFSNIKDRLKLVVEDKTFDEDSQMVGILCRFDKALEQSIFDGQSCTVRSTYDIGSYDMILPRECVVMEGAAYVYRLETVKSVIGDSDLVRKLEVTIVAEDDYHVAITGGVSLYDNIVRYFTKPLRNELKVRTYQ